MMHKEDNSMPNSMFSLDAGFPQFTGQESDKQKVSAIYDYLIQLQQTLRYCLQNLGGDNFNDKELEIIGKTIREPIRLEITGQGKRTELSLKAGDTVLSSDVITLDGVVTFTKDDEGRSVIDGGNIYSEKIAADTGYFVDVRVQMPGRPEFAMINPFGIHVGSDNQTGVYTASIAASNGKFGIEGYTQAGIEIKAAGPITIGKEGKTLNLVGDVYVNGTKIS
jgi:hypothetical protein